MDVPSTTKFIDINIDVLKYMVTFLDADTYWALRLTGKFGKLITEFQKKERKPHGECIECGNYYGFNIELGVIIDDNKNNEGSRVYEEITPLCDWCKIDYIKLNDEWELFYCFNSDINCKDIGYRRSFPCEYRPRKEPHYRGTCEISLCGWCYYCASENLGNRHLIGNDWLDAINGLDFSDPHFPGHSLR